MKIISKQYPCTCIMEDGKKALQIDFTNETIVANDDLDKEYEDSHDNIIKTAQYVGQKNTNVKKLKASFMKEGQTGTITLKYLI